MPAKLPFPAVKLHVRLDEADVDMLNVLFPRRVNEVVRSIVRAYCDNLRKKGLSAKVTALSPSLPLDDDAA